MVSLRALFLGSLLPLTVVLSAGCSDKHGGRMEVTGAVKLQGQPLKDGLIRFVPLDGQDTPGGGPIQNGEYKIPRANGLKPGNYLVQLSSGDGKTPNEEEAGGPGGSTNIVSVDQIPDEWNVRSKQQVEVKSSGANRFDFDVPLNPRLKKKP
jgi:hypothetical protein